LKYKCESLGIKEFSEDYTSFVTDEVGERVKRGLFKDSKLNKVFNANCNACFNILKREAKLLRLIKLFDLKTLFKKLCNLIRFGFFKFVELVQSVIPSPPSGG